MVRRRRNDFDCLKAIDKPTWLVVTDMTARIVSWMEFPPQENLRKRFAEVIAATYAAGWEVEEYHSRSGSFFCHRDGKRRHVHIQPTPPQDRMGLGRVPAAAADIASCVGIP